MRLNKPYNLLGSGNPFCYRGIFSGLSNEPMGSAFYTLAKQQLAPQLLFSLYIRYINFSPMPQSDEGLLPLLVRYNEPLTRYARLQLQNKHLAADIVKFVLEELYDQQAIYEGPHLRPLLIQRVSSACNIVNRLQESDWNRRGTPFSNPSNQSPKSL